MLAYAALSNPPFFGFEKAPPGRTLPHSGSVTPDFSAPALPLFLPPPPRGSLRFRQGVFTISAPQGRDASRDVMSGLMHAFRSELSRRVEEPPRPFAGVFRRTHKTMKFEDLKTGLRLF